MKLELYKVNHLIENKSLVSRAVVLIQESSSSEIKDLIQQAKNLGKPLLTVVIEQLLDEPKDMDNYNPIIKRLLTESEVGDWDHEFPNTTYIISSPPLNKIYDKKQYELLAAVIYRLSPSVLMRELQRKNLYKELIGAEALAPLLAISAVLGEANTEDVKIFSTELNTILCKANLHPKKHQVLLLKHDKLFTKATQDFLDRTNAYTDDEYIKNALFNNLIECKRGLVNGRQEQAVIDILINNPASFFNLLEIDPLSVSKLITTLNKKEINTLITNCNLEGINPLESLLENRQFRSGDADKALYDAILDHTYFANFISQEVLDQYAKQPENQLRNCTAEERFELSKDFWIIKRMQSFAVKPNNFIALMKNDPLLAGRYIESMNREPLGQILRSHENFSTLLNQVIQLLLLSDPTSLPYHMNWTYNSTQLEAGVNALIAANHIEHDTRSFHFPSHIGYQPVPRYFASSEKVEQNKYVLILAERVIGTVSNALAAAQVSWNLDCRSMVILLQCLNLIESSDKNFEETINTLFKFMQLNTLIYFEQESAKAKPETLYRLLTPIQYLFTKMPASNEVLMNLLDQTKGMDTRTNDYVTDKLRDLLIELLNNKDFQASLGSRQNKEVLDKLFVMFPYVIEKHYPALMLPAQPDTLPQPAPLYPTRDLEIERLKAHIQELQGLTQALQLENTQLKARLEIAERPLVDLTPRLPNPAASNVDRTSNTNVNNARVETARPYYPSQSLSAGRTYHEPIVIEVPIEEGHPVYYTNKNS